MTINLHQRHFKLTEVSLAQKLTAAVNWWDFFSSYFLKRTLAELKHTCFFNWPLTRSNFFCNFFQIVVVTKNISGIGKQFIPVKNINSVREYNLCKSPYGNNCIKTIIRYWTALFYAINMNCNLEWADNKGVVEVKTRFVTSNRRPLREFSSSFTCT